MTVQNSVDLQTLANELYEEGFIDFAVISAVVEKLTTATGPLQNEIIHLETQLRQAEKALANVKISSYNEGVEDSASVIENSPEVFAGWSQEVAVAEEIRNLKK